MGTGQLSHQREQKRQHRPHRPGENGRRPSRGLFHCQTNLVETFRELYPELSYSANRAILLDADAELPKVALSHCVALALIYHLNKRKGGR
jgi:hypothetical protein